MAQNLKDEEEEMKKIFIPLMVVVVTVLVLTGCMPGAPEEAPPVTPPPVTPPPVTPPEAPAAPITAGDLPAYQELISKGIVSPDLVINPFGEDFAVKPDGTPFKFALTEIFLAVDSLAQGEKMCKSILERAGAEVISFDPGADPAKQVAFLEDLAATIQPDGLLIQPVNELALTPAIEKAHAAGITVVVFDFILPTDVMVSTCWHWFDGPQGSNQVGQYLVDRATAENRQLNVFEVWGDMATDSAHRRHAGFHSAIDQCPLITVRESGDTKWSVETCAAFVMDAFTVYPELNAVYTMGGEAPGVIDGLRAAGKLFPPEDPRHVIAALNDVDSPVAEALATGYIDACGSHSGMDMMDVGAQVLMVSCVLGQPVPKRVDIPMVLLTGDTIETVKLLGIPVYPVLPKGQWDIWPVSDISLMGIVSPTLANRMLYKGY